MKASTSPRLHADRIARRHRHHRGADRPAAARGPGGPRGRPPLPVLQQHEADRPGPGQLREQQRQLPASAPSTATAAATRAGPPATAATSTASCWRSCRSSSSRRSYNAHNFNVHFTFSPNTTVMAVGVNTYFCPSDPDVQEQRPDPGSFCNEPGGSCPQAIMRHPSYRGSTGTAFYVGRYSEPSCDTAYATRISKARRHVLLQHQRHPRLDHRRHQQHDGHRRAGLRPARLRRPVRLDLVDLRQQRRHPGQHPGAAEPPEEDQPGDHQHRPARDQRLDPLPQLLEPAPRRDERHLRRRLGPVHQGHDQHRAL